MAGGRGLIAVTVAVALIAGAAAGADTRIRPGKGIGRIDLGMTEAQVRARLGAPEYVTPRRVRSGFGQRYVELVYDNAYFTVGLLGRPGRLRVVVVSTLQRSERTSQGFGIGTMEARLARAYGGRFRCERMWPSPQGHVGGTRDCVVAARGAETVYVTALERPTAYVRLEDWRKRARVLEVRIRRADLPRGIE